MTLTPRQQEILNRGSQYEDPEVKAAILRGEFAKAPQVGYRVESGLLAGPDTVGEIIRFEREELGNIEESDHISDELLRQLDQIDAEEAIWVTRTREAAKFYLSKGEPESYIQEINLGDDAVILVDIGEEGMLVMYHPPSYYLSFADNMQSYKK